MSLTVTLIEPDARPAQSTTTVLPDEPFSLFLLLEERDGRAVRLRETVLRRGDEAAPVGAVFIFQAVAVGPRPQEPARVVVRRTSREALIELERGAGAGRVTADTTLPTGSRLSVSLPERRAVQVTIEVAAAAARGARAVVGGSAARRSWAVSSAAGAVWMVPAALGAFATPKARAVGWVMRQVKRLGVPPAMIIPLVVVLGGGVALGAVAWGKHRAAQDAEQRAEEAVARAEAAEAGRDAALLAEASCLDARAALAADLADERAALEIAAERALNPALSRSMAAELGGSRMTAGPVQAFDEQGLRALRVAVADRLLAGMEAVPEGVVRCLDQEVALGLDLPAYALLWHPDPSRLCPEGYSATLSGVSRAGPWGLSERTAREYGPESASSSGDPRMGERWSATTLASGLRAVQGAVLGAPTGDRAPVLPAQAQIWALALWHALDAMPERADAEPSARLADCVAPLLGGLANATSAADAGEPVLPDIAAVAAGESVPLAPTPTCPWSPEGLRAGAEAAIFAAARRAMMEQQGS